MSFDICGRAWLTRMGLFIALFVHAVIGTIDVVSVCMYGSRRDIAVVVCLCGGLTVTIIIQLLFLKSKWYMQNLTSQAFFA